MKKSILIMLQISIFVIAACKKNDATVDVQDDENTMVENGIDIWENREVPVIDYDEIQFPQDIKDEAVMMVDNAGNLLMKSPYDH